MNGVSVIALLASAVTACAASGSGDGSLRNAAFRIASGVLGAAPVVAADRSDASEIGLGETPATPHGLEGAMRHITEVGSAPGLLATLGVAWLVAPGAALGAADAALGTAVSVQEAKMLVGRARPSDAPPDPYVLLGPHFQPDDGIESWPSGHSALSAAVLGSLGRAYPQAAPALESLAVLVGLSRVYLGRHWPSDVVAGHALGDWWAEATP